MLTGPAVSWLCVELGWSLLSRLRHKTLRADPSFVTLPSLAGCLIIKSVQKIFLSDKGQSWLNCKVNWKLLECLLHGDKRLTSVFTASPEERNWSKFFSSTPWVPLRDQGVKAAEEKYAGGGRSSPPLSEICVNSPSMKAWYWVDKSARWIWKDWGLGVFFCRFSLALLGANPPKLFGRFSFFMVFQRDMRIHRIAITALHGLYLVIYWWFRSKHMQKDPDESSCKFLPVLQYIQVMESYKQCMSLTQTLCFWRGNLAISLCPPWCMEIFFFWWLKCFNSLADKEAWFQANGAEFPAGVHPSAHFSDAS